MSKKINIVIFTNDSGATKTVVMRTKSSEELLSSIKNYMSSHSGWEIYNVIKL